jgi:Ca2+/H+ antiporter, TMEM165/GDT1 family
VSSSNSSTPPSGAFGVFLSTFITILLAELGDKTQITILLMSAEFKHPLPLFLGAAIALVMTSLLGVLAGRWLSSHLSPQLLNRLAGITLLIIAVGLVWDAVFGHP